MSEPIVTDHAVLRYLERAQGVDVEAARAAISDSVRRGVAAGAAFVTHGGLRFVIKGGYVVTALDKQWTSAFNEIRGRGHE